MTPEEETIKKAQQMAYLRGVQDAQDQETLATNLLNTYPTIRDFILSLEHKQIINGKLVTETDESGNQIPPTLNKQGINEIIKILRPIMNPQTLGTDLTPKKIAEQQRTIMINLRSNMFINAMNYSPLISHVYEVQENDLVPDHVKLIERENKKYAVIMQSLSKSQIDTICDGVRELFMTSHGFSVKAGFRKDAFGQEKTITQKNIIEEQKSKGSFFK